jgi:hypothetical protein
MGVLPRRQLDEVRSYCRLAQVDGLSLRRALLEYRAAGRKVRTATFVRVWRHVKAEAGA